MTHARHGFSLLLALVIGLTGLAMLTFQGDRADHLPGPDDPARLAVTMPVLLVGMRDPAVLPEVQRIIIDLDINARVEWLRRQASVDAPSLVALHFPIPVVAGRWLDQVRALPGVNFAELDGPLYPSGYTLEPVSEVDATGGGVPWHLIRIHADNAWRRSQGEGVTVAVIDSGVNAQHSALREHVLPGRNVVTDTDDVTDLTGHGTQVAGVIVSNFNRQARLAGVASGARILPLRVTNQWGEATVAGVVKAILYAAERGIPLVNVSYEALQRHPGVVSAAKVLHEKGGLLIVSAGNRGQRHGTSTPQVGMLVVGGTTSQDHLASYSNFGPHLSLVAPASLIRTTTLDGYGDVTGTSFAAPLVSGVAALLLSRQPQWGPDRLRVSLERSADDLGPPGHDEQFGWGLVNAERALTYADPLASP